MKIFHLLHPGRHLVVRLFLWFWVTLLLTALLALWVGRNIASDIDIAPIPQVKLAKLQKITSAIEHRINEGRSLGNTVRKVSRFSRQPLVIFDVNNNAVEKVGGPPMGDAEQKALRKLLAQQTPIAITHGRDAYYGPSIINVNNRQYRLFLSQPSGKGPGFENKLIWVIPAVLIISGGFCFLFALSIVKPIAKLRNTTYRLAKGQWDARVDSSGLRKDELGRLAEDFNQMAEQLSRLWHGQKRLLGDISHELRSPLARIQMALGIAHQQNVESETLVRIEREAERMEALIKQLLMLSRVESITSPFEKVSLLELLGDVFSDAQFEANAAGKTFIPCSLPEHHISANPILLQSAVENVIRNAIRYAATRVDVSYQQNSTQWQITISDDGPGLSVDECERVFAPFYRPTDARDRESGGVGLGLAIAKAAITAHKGTIEARPLDTKGLAVTITIPLID